MSLILRYQPMQEVVGGCGTCSWLVTPLFRTCSRLRDACHSEPGDAKAACTWRACSALVLALLGTSSVRHNASSKRLLMLWPVAKSCSILRRTSHGRVQ